MYLRDIGGGYIAFDTTILGGVLWGVLLLLVKNNSRIN